MVLYSMGFNVIATDKHSIVSTILGDNIATYLATSSQGTDHTIEQVVLDWEADAANQDNLLVGKSFDLILCSDCLYNSMSVHPLLEIIETVKYTLFYLISPS
jgi:hypothetical protein